MKKLFLIVVGLVFMNSAWAKDWSDKPIIDHKYRDVVLQLKKVKDECRKKEKNVIKKMKCGKELRKEYEKQGKLRGTDEYCKKHYGKLSFEKLRKVWRHLKQQRRIARIVTSGDEIIPGEVTEGMFLVEEIWVESRLAQIQKQRTVEAEKELYKNQ